VGDLLTFIQRHGKTYIGKIRQKSDGTVTPKQQEARDKFLAASRYAKGVLNDPEKLAIYKEKTEPGITPFNLALADFISVPEVSGFDTTLYTGAIGGIIRITATDDNMVTEVRVRITSAAGATLEEGLAVLNAETQTFDYTATVANGVLAGSKITAFAKDLPGNVTEQEMVL
jgi:hypothetical protein